MRKGVNSSVSTLGSRTCNRAAEARLVGGHENRELAAMLAKVQGEVSIIQGELAGATRKLTDSQVTE